MKRSTTLLTALTILLSVWSCTQQKSELTPDEAKAIAKEAYIYGFPMVMGYKAMNAYILDKTNPEYKGPFNYLSCDARLLTPDDKAIVTPNSDTPYCMMWGDISQEPVVITVPEMEPERFYHFQLVDLYTHNFAYIGTLTTGNGAGDYMITGAGWSGEKPEGVQEVISCETPLFFIIVRTQLFGPDDLENVKAIQEAYNIQTLSEYLGGEPVPKKETIDIPAWNEGDQFTVAIFPYIDALLDLVTPVPAETELMARFAKLGLGKGKTFKLENYDEDVQKAIEEGVKDGRNEVDSFLKGLNKDPLASAKIFGTREFLSESARDNYQMDDFYLLRATAAHLGLYGNSGKEAIYPVYLTDSEGSPLNAATNNYTITFEKGQLPPVKSFWSVTMYDGKTQLMIHNPLDRYLLNSSMTENFVYAKDGSLTLYFRKDSPGNGMDNNWLPAPEGPFYCVLRLYGPEVDALNGTWKNPPMVNVK